MSLGTTEVVGLIELDHPSASALEHSLSPSVSVRRRPRSPSGVAQVVAASDGDEAITADLRQLKRELRAELAYVLARLKKSLHGDA